MLTHAGKHGLVSMRTAGIEPKADSKAQRCLQTKHMACNFTHGSYIALKPKSGALAIGGCPAMGSGCGRGDARGPRERPLQGPGLLFPSGGRCPPPKHIRSPVTSAKPKSGGQFVSGAATSGEPPGTIGVLASASPCGAATSGTPPGLAGVLASAGSLHAHRSRAKSAVPSMKDSRSPCVPLSATVPRSSTALGSMGNDIDSIAVMRGGDPGINVNKGDDDNNNDCNYSEAQSHKRSRKHAPPQYHKKRGNKNVALATAANDGLMDEAWEIYHIDFRSAGDTSENNWNT